MRDLLVGVVMIGLVGPIIALLIAAVFGTAAYVGLIGLVVFTNWFADAVPYGGDIVIAAVYAVGILLALVACVKFGPK
jgi:hypothetical protein